MVGLGELRVTSTGRTIPFKISCMEQNLATEPCSTARKKREGCLVGQGNVEWDDGLFRRLGVGGTCETVQTNQRERSVTEDSVGDAVGLFPRCRGICPLSRDNFIIVGKTESKETRLQEAGKSTEVNHGHHVATGILPICT